MGIGIGISLVSVRVSHGYRSMLVYYVYSAIWDTVILCLRYRSFSTKVQQSSLGLYYAIGYMLILGLGYRSYSTKVQQRCLGRHGEHTYVRMKHCQEHM